MIGTTQELINYLNAEFKPNQKLCVAIHTVEEIEQRLKVHGVETSIENVSYVLAYVEDTKDFTGDSTDYAADELRSI